MPSSTLADSQLSATTDAALNAALARARALMLAGQRRILGIVGPPGSGKSTLATLLCQGLNAAAALVPMDGFHLAQTELERLGRAARKGAPDTFDSAGYVALLQRLRCVQNTATIYAPTFNRALEEPIAGAIAVAADVPLVITEGNYLLMNQADAPNCHWHQARALLDQVWYIDIDDTLRQQRLTQRHIQHGRSPEAALAWVKQTDEPNAQKIAATRSRADWCMVWG